MSISQITKITSSTPPTEADPNSKGLDKAPLAYNLAKANITFLGEAFVDGMQLFKDGSEDHVKYQSCIPVNIRNYSNVKALRQEFNFHKNGFEYCKIKKESPLSRAIEQYGKALETNTPYSGGQQFMHELKQFLSSWGEKNGIPGIPALAVELYRCSVPNEISKKVGAANPFFFAHADVYSYEITNPSSTTRDAYKRAAEREFGKMSDEDYDTITHHAQVNVWIPLHDMPSNNTLAMMDTHSVPDLSHKLRHFSSDGTISLSLHADPRQVWVAKEDLTRKDDLIMVFNTTSTLHTATNIEGVPESPRMSTEFKFDFISQ